MKSFTPRTTKESSRNFHKLDFPAPPFNSKTVSSTFDDDDIASEDENDDGNDNDNTPPFNSKTVSSTFDDDENASEDDNDDGNTSPFNSSHQWLTTTTTTAMQGQINAVKLNHGKFWSEDDAPVVCVHEIPFAATESVNEMFARKTKSSDAHASIQRFIDLSRDPQSRVKHFKLLLDTLTTNEKKQLIDEHSFETFHLVDELLLGNDVSSQMDSVVEAESGLWALEQILCLAPELVGSGWQRHAIESLLKKAIYPRNLLSVRKIAIRIFLMFYQCLGVAGKVDHDLDKVFQSLLPHFPLKNNESTEDILTAYCQSAGQGDWCDRLKNDSFGSNSGSSGPSAKERAQLLQVYLDKFLEYCTRETLRIEWTDEKKRFECAKFIIDKVIKLYIGECFDDLEENGVDVFGGWEGAEAVGEPLDTTDPVVIARYWLIRWINNIASAAQAQAGTSQTTHASLLLYRDALFSSQKATNIALTLMREAMILPLACSNVTHRVVSVLNTWILQYEIPPFVQSGEVSIERSSLLLSNILLSFFYSPYLNQPGDKLQSVVSISYSILQTCRQLVTFRTQLPRSLPQKFWAELISTLCRCGTKICSQPDMHAQQVSYAFTWTIVCCAVVIKAVRRIEIDDSVWDEVHNFMSKGVWVTMAEQWARIVNSVTRALILHITHVDIFSREEAIRRATETTRRSGVTSTPDERTPRLGHEASADGDTISDDFVFDETDDITIAVSDGSGDQTVWLQTWRRVISLVDPFSNANAHVAIDAITETIYHLFGANLHPLAHWLATRLMCVPPVLLPRCVPALTTILTASRRPPPLLTAHILLAFIKMLHQNEPIVLPAIASLSADDLSIVAPRALDTVMKMLEKSTRNGSNGNVLKLFAMLAPCCDDADDVLMRQLNSSEISPENASTCVNSLSILVVQRADVKKLMKVLDTVLKHKFAQRLLPLFCSNLSLMAKFNSISVLDVLLRTALDVSNERARTEIEWRMASLCLKVQQPQYPLVMKGLIAEQQHLLQGEMITMAGQYPLKGFGVARWNSIEPQPMANSPEKDTERSVYVKKSNSIISVSRGAAGQCDVTCRTVVGRHLWSMDTDETERPKSNNVAAWLKKESLRGRKSGRESVGILGAMDDPFDELPETSNDEDSMFDLVNSAQWSTIIEGSRRQPQPVQSMNKHETPGFRPSSKLLEWRSMSASLGFVPLVAQVSPTFTRDLKHLDQTAAREAHKVAVIYVSDGQDEKTAILSNNIASQAFDDFVENLGWEVRIGRGHEGYHGGLPLDTRAPYFADADCELIFHVSTMLSGDVHQKWKHIGNDEVHVVWSENRTKAYTRETIATKFCDVLIVLENIGSDMVRVRIDTVSHLEFGPLFDGALIQKSELPHLVRLTVLNASRAYRLARLEHQRPLRHRESVFCGDTLALMKPLSLSNAINSLYIPTV